MRAGLAVDIGTTNITAALVNLQNKKTLAVRSIPNSQAHHGRDVITRLNSFLKESNLAHLQAHLISDINQTLKNFSRRYPRALRAVKGAVVVGNPTMMHFFLKEDPSTLAVYPYSPAFHALRKIKAGALGLHLSPFSEVTVLPLLAGMVGADAVAGILDTRMAEKDSVSLLLDLGTNAEIILGSKKGFLVCSTPAGPAFRSSRLPLGSDVITEVARLLARGQIDYKGQLEGTAGLSQKDIRALQLAKAAVRAGIDILLGQAKVPPAEIARIYLGGRFGQKINRLSARRIGLLPEVALSRVISLGNVALEGAKRFLLDRRARALCRRIAKKAVPVELADDERFSEKFVGYMNF